MLLLAALLAASGCVAARPATLCAHLEGAGDSSTDALDPVHQGDAMIRLEKTAIRFSIVAPGLQTVTATHIHHGASGTYGPMFWEINSGYKGDAVRGTASDIPPGMIALSRSARYPMIPAQSSGAEAAGSSPSGRFRTKCSSTTI